MCLNIKEECKILNKDLYEIITMMVEQSPIGANRLLFNPSLAGGSAANFSAAIRGAFIGLDLSHNQSDLLRSCFEGIVFDLCIMYHKLKSMCDLENKLLIVGGGSKNRTWLQMFADVFETTVIKTNIDQEAGSLGAAVVGGIGCGIWASFNIVEQIIKVENESKPDILSSQKYKQYYDLYVNISKQVSKMSESLARI